MGRWKWQDRDRNERENLLIEIEERKLFYVRLEGFVNAVVKELEQLSFLNDHKRIFSQGKNTANHQNNDNK